tara:strand:- start:4958 stop:5188 length:231 start_codon:yes stop_codon:yes gene_type:complete
LYAAIAARDFSILERLIINLLLASDLLRIANTAKALVVVERLLASSLVLSSAVALLHVFTVSHLTHLLRYLYDRSS